MGGELLSLLVAVMWTFTAIFAEIASKRMGTLVLNVWRMILTIVLLGLLLWFTCGKPWPQHTTPEVWKWFLASGFMGFVFGDYCLFNAYVVIGSRYAQLFMTLGCPFAAITARRPSSTRSRRCRSRKSRAARSVEKVPLSSMEENTRTLPQPKASAWARRKASSGSTRVPSVRKP